MTISTRTNTQSLDFLRKRALGWKSIFYSNRELRGSRNVVARYYGVSNVPLYWLVDAGGVVRDIDLEPAQLDAALRRAAGA